MAAQLQLARALRLTLLVVGLMGLPALQGANAAERRSPQPDLLERDCPACPQMVVVPAGAFLMGSPETEPGRGRDEGPQRRITIAKPFALSRHEITRGQYRVFLDATGRAVRGGCLSDVARKGEWAPHPTANLWNPGFAQSDDHPAVCVGWDDAQAYVAWLSRETGRNYRLPTEAEWEYAARAGTTGIYPWGAVPDLGCRDANLADQTVGEEYPDWKTAACRDGAVRTAPVGSYRANAFGLYDMIGNVGEWVADCATSSHDTLPADGGANLGGDCARRVVRSSSFGSQPPHDRVANRLRYLVDHVDDSIGIRVVRELD